MQHTHSFGHLSCGNSRDQFIPPLFLNIRCFYSSIWTTKMSYIRNGGCIYRSTRVQIMKSKMCCLRWCFKHIVHLMVLLCSEQCKSASSYIHHPQHPLPATLVQINFFVGQWTSVKKKIDANNFIFHLFNIFSTT